MQAIGEKALPRIHLYASLFVTQHYYCMISYNYSQFSPVGIVIIRYCILLEQKLVSQQVTFLGRCLSPTFLFKSMDTQKFPAKSRTAHPA
jgi:hypothetical protein